MGKIYVYYYSKYNNVQNLVFGSRWHFDIFLFQLLLNFYGLSDVLILSLGQSKWYRMGSQPAIVLERSWNGGWATAGHLEIDSKMSILRESILALKHNMTQLRELLSALLRPGTGSHPCQVDSRAPLFFLGHFQPF